ncbi:MAG: trigger factor [Patescibacteria group bacterium]
MEVKVTELPKSRVEIKVRLSGEEFSPYFTIGSREVSKTLNIPGFRSGKAPEKIVEEKVGTARILEEAANIAINTVFPKIVGDRKLEILGNPKAEIQKLSREELEALIKVPVFPRVQLPSWKEIARSEPRKKIELGEGEESESLKYLQKSRAKIFRKSAPAERGDFICIDYEIRKNGVKIEQGDIKEQKFILGEGRLLPGFEEKLIGCKEKEERFFSLQSPADFWKKELKGAKLEFKVKMRDVFRMELPLVNDEFAKSLGKFENLSQFKKSLREGIKSEKEGAEKKRWELAVLDKIAKGAKMDVPDVLIENERDQMMDNLRIRVEETGISLQDYLTHLKKSEEQLRKDFLPEAEKRVRIFVSLYQITREEKIEVNEKEINQKIKELLLKNPHLGKELQDKAKEVNLKNYLKENILQGKVIELLFVEAGEKR